MKRYFQPITGKSPDKRIKTDSTRLIQTEECSSLEATNRNDGPSKELLLESGCQVSKIEKDGRNPSTFMTWNANSFLLRIKKDSHEFQKSIEQHDPDIIAIQVWMTALRFMSIKRYLTLCVTKASGLLYNFELLLRDGTTRCNMQNSSNLLVHVFKWIMDWKLSGIAAHDARSSVLNITEIQCTLMRPASTLSFCMPYCSEIKI